MTYVIDSSVFIKWVVAEEGSSAAAELMREPVCAPDLLVPECANVLWKKVRRGELVEAEAAGAIRALQISGISFEPTRALASEILELALRLAHPAYDCAYLTLARKLGGVLVTADERLIRRCRQPDTPDLSPLVRSLFQFRSELRERPARPYRARRARA